MLQETVEWLARAENFDPDRSPPGLQNFDPLPFVLSSLPITASVMATQVAHELGHRVAAFQKKVRPSAFAVRASSLYHSTHVFDCLKVLVSVLARASVNSLQAPPKISDLTLCQPINWN